MTQEVNFKGILTSPSSRGSMSIRRNTMAGHNNVKTTVMQFEHDMRMDLHNKKRSVSRE